MKIIRPKKFYFIYAILIIWLVRAVYMSLGNENTMGLLLNSILLATLLSSLIWTIKNPYSITLNNGVLSIFEPYFKVRKFLIQDVEKISVDYQFFKWTKLELKNGNKVRLHPDSLSESDLELLKNEFKEKG